MIGLAEWLFDDYLDDFWLVDWLIDSSLIDDQSHHFIHWCIRWPTDYFTGSFIARPPYFFLVNSYSDLRKPCAVLADWNIYALKLSLTCCEFLNHYLHVSSTSLTWPVYEIQLVLVSLTFYDLFLYIAEKNNTIYWLAAVVAEFIIMVCAFKFFLYTKGSGIIFSAKKNVAASEMNKEKRDDEKSGGCSHFTKKAYFYT